jgi:hypothetical protein
MEGDGLKTGKKIKLGIAKSENIVYSISGSA